MARCELSLVFAAFGLLALGSAGASRSEDKQELDKVDWWKKTNYYHIYVRSFKDSDGDGNGDLAGVTEKIDYLKAIGVETILMAPFYSSPMKDCGYDISNYVDINPMFGSMRDFDKLVEELKRRDMRIVVDFVPNHSSNKHLWFECSERALLEPERCGKYKDYYIWSDSKRFEGKYPSNWISVFGGVPAWTWSELRQQFYLHQFLPEQPDLNFTNPEVLEEFRNVARFWLAKGVDGLRVDSAIYLYENTDDFPDEPPSSEWKSGDDPADRLAHIHTRALHKSAELVKDWRLLAEKEFPGQRKVIITEAYDKIPKLIEYYGNNHEDRFADLPFNFELFKLKQANLKADYIEEVAMNWIKPTRALGWPDEQGAMSPWILWVTGNHDNPRITTRLGRQNVALYRVLAYLLPGTPVNYYGDEIPIQDANFSDISQRTIDEGESSRLPFRVPIAWTNEEPSGGFSSSKDIWLPLNANWKTSNVAYLLSEASEPKNELNLFVALQKLRNTHMDIFVFGDLVFFHNKQPTSEQSQMLLTIGRTHERFGSILMLANLDSNNEVSVRLEPNESKIRNKQLEPPTSGQIVYTNLIDTSKAPLVQDKAVVQLDDLVLAPSQLVLIKY